MGESSTNTILFPWLLYSHGKNYRNKTFCNIAGFPRQSSPIPHPKHKTILGSSHGWLLVKNNKTDSKYALSPAPEIYYLWNPITLESIHFPPFNSKPERKIVSFILSSPPDDDDPNSMLLLFEATIPAVFVCRLSKPEWIELRYDNFYGKLEKGHLNNPVSYNGNVFAKGGERELFRVEVKHDDTIFLHPLIHLPLFPAPRSNLVLENLVECCGELYIVHCSPSDVQDSRTRNMVAVHIFKLNFSGMIWEKVDNIHDHAFFLSHDIAISCSAAALSSFPALKNCICFTTEKGKDNILYFYHVEDGTLTMCPPCSDLPTPWSPPIWVSLPTLGTNKGEQKEEPIKALVFAEERKDNKEKVSPWTNLPMDMQKLISEKLPPFDYMNFRATCRMSRVIAPPIQWRTKLALAGSDQLHSFSPWIIYSPAGKNVCNVLDPNLNGRYLVKTPESFQDPIVRCCKESWLLMSESGNSKDGLLLMFLFNPFTKATIQLPSLVVEERFPAVRFSLFPYSSGRCYVVCFLNRYKRVNFLVTYPGSERWHFIPYLDDTQLFYPVDNAPVYFSNCLYYFGEDGKVGVLSKDEGGWAWYASDVEGRPDNFQYNYFVECDGGLLSIFVGYSGAWVKVFRLCRDDGPPTIWQWEQVYDLGKRIIYLSRLSTVSKAALVEGTENRIYLEKLHRERVIYYSLNTNRFHTSYDKDSRKSYYNTSEPLLCAWIEPNWCDKLPQCKGTTIVLWSLD